MAEERSIQIEESIRSSKIYENLVEVRVQIDGGIQNTVIGQVTADQKLVINKINKYNIKFELAGVLFLVDFIDRPGMIGAICSFLGKNNINIAELQVARLLHLGTQLMALKVDDVVQPEVITELAKVKDINWVQYYSF